VIVLNIVEKIKKGIKTWTDVRIRHKVMGPVYDDKKSIESIKKISFKDLSTWDKRWFEQAVIVSKYSKDPSTKVGCVVAKGSDFKAFGFNGFPGGIKDDDRLLDREVKRKMILHAEENVLHKVWDVTGCTAYIYPLQSCSKCTANLIQRGISRVVFKEPSERHKKEYDYDLVMEMYQEAGVEVVEIQNRKGVFK